MLIGTTENPTTPLAARRGLGADAAPAALRHESLLYSGEEEFLAATLPGIARAVEAGQPALVAVDQERTALLRRALGRRARGVAFADVLELARNPARMIPAWARFLRESAPDDAALVIGEPMWPGRSAAELAECERHEWLVNLAFKNTQQPLRLVCCYDRDRLDEQALAAARRSHPLLLCGCHCEANGAYREPDWAVAAFAGRLAPPRAAVTELPFSCSHLADVRAVVRRAAIDAALSPERSEEVVLAASELAANSVQYGGGSGSARIWRQDGALLCEVSDRGRLQSALAGRVQPDPHQLRGRGLWLVNQLCDLVQIRSGERGTTVRVRFELAA